MRPLRLPTVVWAILVILASGLVLSIVDGRRGLRTKSGGETIDQQFQYVDYFTISQDSGIMEHVSMLRAGSKVTVISGVPARTRTGSLGMQEWVGLWTALQRSEAFALTNNRAGNTKVEYRLMFGDSEAVLYHYFAFDDHALDRNPDYRLVYDLVRSVMGRVTWDITANTNCAKGKH